MRIQQRFIFLFTVAGLVPVLVAGAVAYELIRRSTVESALARLNGLAALQESRIDDIIGQNAERLSSFTNRSDLRRLLALQREGTPAPAALRELLTDALRAGESFRSVSVTDKAGSVIASTRADYEGSSLTAEEAFVRAQQRSVVSEIAEHPDGSLVFRLIGPVFNGGVRVGMAVIETDASNLFAVSRDYRSLGRTGETVISRRQTDGSAQVIAPMRTDPDAAMRRTIPEGDVPGPTAQALSRREDVFQGVEDYRGVSVFAATRYVDNPEYGLVVKIDEDEVLEPLRPLRNLLVETLLLTSLATFIISLYAARRTALPIVRLTEVARRVAEGGEAAEVPQEGGDEIADLARSFNVMVDNLLTSQRRLEASVRSMPVGVLIVRGQDEILVRNDMVGTILGVRGKSFRMKDVLAALPKDAKIEDRLRECLTGGRLIEMKDIDLDGRSVRILLAPVRSSKAGQPASGFVLLAEDVSEAKRLERAKNEFVSVASHQLRTPLTAIKGGASMLLDRDLGPINKQQEEFLSDIRNSNDRMIALVNSLLNVSRIDLGVFAVEPQPTDIPELIGSVNRELAVTVREKRLTYSTTIDDRVRMMNVDPELMRMVFQNLLHNAVKYTPSGGSVALDVRKVGDRVTITVTDTGYGIPAAQQPKIFGKMFRADNARQHDPDGSGLGLYIVKAIIESTGGSIGFTSVEGRGSVFRVTLPAEGMRPKIGEKKLQ